MDRLLALYRSTSSSVAVAALVVANAIPLIGVIAFGWDLLTILVIYWLENGVVGAYNVLRMLVASGGANAGVGEAAVKVTMIPFFIVHYGIFWVVHGVFVFALPSFGGIGGGVVSGFLEFGEVLEIERLAIAVVILAISHGVSFYLNFIRAGEYRRVSAAELMMRPYGRVVVLHMTILVGAFAIAATGAPVAALVVLVAIKTAIDLGLHLAEHRRWVGGGDGANGAGPARA